MIDLIVKIQTFTNNQIKDKIGVLHKATIFSFSCFVNLAEAGFEPGRTVSEDQTRAFPLSGPNNNACFVLFYLFQKQQSGKRCTNQDSAKSYPDCFLMRKSYSKI